MEVWVSLFKEVVIGKYYTILKYKEETQMPSNKMIGTVVLGAAAYLMRNKETREKTISQIKSIANPEMIDKVKSQLQSFTKSKSSNSTIN